MSWQLSKGCSPAVSSQYLLLGSPWVRTQLLPHQIHLGSGTTKQNPIASTEHSVHFGHMEHPVYLLELLKYVLCPWEVLLILQHLGQSTTLGFGSSTAGLVVQGPGMLAGPLPESPHPLPMALFCVACNLKYKRRYRYNIELNYI